ncbi:MULTISPECIES: hypothetical protein [Bacillus cereus group]|uniref:Uncharacterized protein n=1 Tax=Bacillus cereus VD021 TaxID=1053224 RepID=R8HEN5_BACCE|nr:MULTISPECIES: hypothetical protein [Bacillus cereus group]EOO71251.1 hypothetical protein IIC_04447 [Bacillus cereus VD021]MCQ6569455.1 hypothetical protein [Bacillus mycoides]QWH04114.1 hypothetical protein EXW52_28725 [Bacillus mycoides]
MKKLAGLIIVTLFFITIVSGLSGKMVSNQHDFKYKNIDNQSVSYMKVDPGEGSPSLFESYESNKVTVNKSIMYRMVDPGGGG